VIGPRWANPENLRRLHDEGDMVRHELVTALASPDLSLVPTLIEGAEVPKATDLPPCCGRWSRCGMPAASEDGWEDATRRLIAEVAEAARLVAKPDLDTLLRDVGAAQHRLTELEQTRRRRRTRSTGCGARSRSYGASWPRRRRGSDGGWPRHLGPWRGATR
jgi:hypothetical protein